MPDHLQNMQEIKLLGSDTQNTYPIDGTTVSVVSSELSSVQVTDKQASNKVKVTPAVSYPWEHRYYFGKLVACHRCGYMMAYAVKAPTGTGASMVRIFNTRSANKILLKNFTGRVVDLAFAHMDSPVLAIIDDMGGIRIEEVYGGFLDTEEIKTRTIIQLAPCEMEQRAPGVLDNQPRLTWCPWIPEAPSDDGEGGEEDGSRLTLGVACGTAAEIFYVDTISQNHSTADMLRREDIRQGYRCISKHTKPITDLALSPDGFAFATASLDGHVLFYKLHPDLQDGELELVFDWQPHGGDAVYSLIFLDDRRPGSNAPLWDCLLTGSEYNRVLRLWRCDTWTCLQEVRFLPSACDLMSPALLVALDVSARFLVISDMKRTVLYVLSLGVSTTERADVQENNGVKTRVLSLSEFVLTAPCISLAVGSACKTRRVEGGGDAEENEIDDVNDDVTHEAYHVTIKMTTVHPKQLQNVTLCFPVSCPNQTLDNSTSGDLFGFQDGLSDVSTSYQENGGSRGVGFASNLGDVVTSSSLTQVSPRTSFTMTPRSSHERGAPVGTPGEYPLAASTEEERTRQSRDQNGGEMTSIVTSPRSEAGSGAAAGVTSGGPVMVAQKVRAGDAAADTEVAEITGEDWPQAPTVAIKRDNSEGRSEEDDGDENGGVEEEEGLETADDEDGGSEEEETEGASETMRDTPLGMADASDGGGMDPTSTQLISVLLSRLENQSTQMERLLRESTEQRQLITQLKASTEDSQTRLTEMERASQQAKFLSRPPTSEELVTAVMKEMNKKFDKSKHDLDNHVMNLVQSLHNTETVMVQHISANVQTSITQSVQATLQAEVKRGLQSNMSRIMDPVRAEVTRQVQEKMTALEAVVKEHITKVVNNKSFVETLSRQVGQTIQGPLTNAYRDAMQSHMVPALDSSLGKLSQEIGTTTQQCMAKMSGLIDSRLETGVRRLSDTQTTAQTNWQAQAVADRRRDNEQLKEALTAVETHLSKKLEQLVQTTRERAETPVGGAGSSHDFEKRRAAMLKATKEANYGKAFEEALTSTHLPLLLELCQMVNPQDLFKQEPCPLQSPVLLSLVQQLGRELSDSTEIKIKYLEEALWNVDRVVDPSVRTHVPKIMASLVRRLDALMASPSGLESGLTRRVKVLKMVACEQQQKGSA